jgi:hypothetical protein
MKAAMAVARKGKHRTPAAPVYTEPTVDYIAKAIHNTDPIAAQRSIVSNAIKEREEQLPHIYGWKWYKWAREFYESQAQLNLLVAGNQLSKSSTMIRKNIEFACNKNLWPEIWKTTPKTFWYFYPSDSVATHEVLKKWIPEFLPRGAMKNHEWYGWDIQMSNGEVSAIHFRSGVSIYFHTYGQKFTVLQTATVHMISGDEEMPVALVDELVARLFATNGIFNTCFTATLGQEFWYRAMECQGTEEETYPQARKWSVSMYDCQFYEDGTPGAWPIEKIKEREALCTSESERLRRIMGRFVREGGLRFSSFTPSKNVKAAIDVPENWQHYVGVDVGSGKTDKKKTRSSGAVCIIAVSPTLDMARVVLTWRGDRMETTSGDILQAYRLLRGDRRILRGVYDNGSAEFGLVAARANEPLTPCEKNRAKWAGIIGLLFQAEALDIDAGVSDNQKLVSEIMSVPSGEKNRTFQDDLIDAMTYAVSAVPWDIHAITKRAAALSGKSLPTPIRQVKKEWPAAPDPRWSENEYMAWQIAYRRGEVKTNEGQGWEGFQDQIEEWNAAYGN